jgi:hypothetical protein
MIILRKKATNGVYDSWEDSDTVTIDANGTHAPNLEIPMCTSTDYELVTGVTDTDDNASYGSGIYTWDGSAWALANSDGKAQIDAIRAEIAAGHPSE